MQLQLKRPLVFFDLETTGLNITQDRIVEISIVKVYPQGQTSPGGENPEVKTRRINPGIPIPEQASNVHHITDEDVKDCPSFKQIAKSLAALFEGCDIAGFNSNRFDIPMLAQEFANAGVDFNFEDKRFIDVQTIFHKKEPRNLVAAYKFYCDKDLTEAHSAQADTMATYQVLMAQLDRYGDLPNDVEKLAEFSTMNRNVDLAGRVIRNDEGVVVFNFGQHKGQPVEKVLAETPQYLDWIMGRDFPENTKKVLQKIFTQMKLRGNNSNIKLK